MAIFSNEIFANRLNKGTTIAIVIVHLFNIRNHVYLSMYIMFIMYIL